MSIIVVASVGSNGVIGRDGDLAWRDRADLLRVRRMTMGHTLVMGRRTFDSIGRPLPGRRTVVVTRQPDWTSSGVERAGSVDEAIEMASIGGGRVFIFGGGDVYAQAMGRAHQLELTHIHCDLDGDVRFPDVDPTAWHPVTREMGDGYEWVTYRRL